MTVKKGDTLYHAETGRPVKVKSTRALTSRYNRGETRVYLESGAEFDIRADGSMRGHWTREQSAQQAQAWANELAEREQAREEAAKVQKSRQSARAQDRDLINGTPTYSPVSVGHNAYMSPTARSVSFAESGYREGPDGHAQPYTRTHEVSIYPDSVANIREDGTTERVQIHAVNWSSYGSMPVEFARQYAAAILAACDAADTLPITPTEEEPQ